MRRLGRLAVSSLLLAAAAARGATFPVTTAADFQAALDRAEPGDTIVLEAGSTYVGNFRLPAKSGAEWITIRTSALEALPPAGTRVAPVDAGAMPRLVPESALEPVIATSPGAHHYRFVGLEITTGGFIDQLVALGSWQESSIAELPHHFIFERCYIHGDPGAGSRRGIAMNAGDGVVVRTGAGAWPERIDWSASDGGVQVLDSYLSDFKHPAWDTQALESWNGAGPFRIENNYLEAAGENVMFGGADPSIADLVPSDIEVVHNHMSKPLAWNKWDGAYAGVDWAVKNLFELKNARRVWVEGNVLENNWVDDQNGFAVLFTPRNQDGRSPWSVVEDVSFVRNVVRHASAGINILGADDIRRSEQTRRIEVSNNLFEDLDHARWGGGTTPTAGRLLQVLKGADGVVIDHNTAFQTRAISYSNGAGNTNFRFTNNLVRHNACGGFNNCGIAGHETYPGDPTLQKYFNGYAPRRNVMWSGYEGWDYSDVNFFPAAVDFEDPSRGDYRLARSAANLAGGFLDSGTDGKDPGADVVALHAATGGVVAGTRTAEATAVTSESATLGGIITAGDGGTTVWFEWGTSIDLAGASVSTASAAAAGSVEISLDVAGLLPETTYYFRVASAARGHADRGTIASFRTAASSGRDSPESSPSTRTPSCLSRQ